MRLWRPRCADLLLVLKFPDCDAYDARLMKTALRSTQSVLRCVHRLQRNVNEPLYRQTGQVVVLIVYHTRQLQCF